MFRLFIASILMLSLASCSGLGIQKSNEENTATGEVVEIEKITDEKTETGSQEEENAEKTASGETTNEIADGSYVSVYYTLRIDSPENEVEETNSEEVAKANNLYQTGATYQPLSFIVGKGSVIAGFENGLLGMKVGEKKTIEVAPEDGYGTGETLSTIPTSQIAPEFEFFQDKRILDDTLTDTISYDDTNFVNLDEAYKNLIKETEIGKEFTLGTTNSKIIARTDTGVTLEFENMESPFYKKEKTVGTKIETDQADLTIKELTDTGVLLTVVNKQSPFYGKDFEEGSVIEDETGKITIKTIEGETVTIGSAHPLAGHTLYFDVEVVNVQ